MIVINGLGCEIMTTSKHFGWWLLGLMGVALGLTGMFKAQAASSSKQTNNIGYSVSAKLPKNQLNKKESFFDLKMKTGQKETLKAVVYNVTNRDIKVQTAIHTAYTNNNGTIEYVTPAKSFDASLTHKMADLAKLSGPKTVTVPANGSKTIKTKVSMPTSPFNGVILGGWYFKRVDQKVTGQVKGSMNVRNVYSYVIGMKFSMGKTPAPKLQLDKVKAGLENYHQSIFPYLRNVSAVIVPQLNLKTTITSKNSGKVVKTATKKNVQMAPNSVFKYPIQLGNTNLQAGRYHLRMVAKNSDHRWVFDRDFTITAAEAKQYNGKAVNNRGMSIWWLIGIGALAMLIIVLLVLWFIFWLRRRRQKRED